MILLLVRRLQGGFIMPASADECRGEKKILEAMQGNAQLDLSKIRSVAMGFSDATYEIDRERGVY